MKLDKYNLLLATLLFFALSACKEVNAPRPPYFAKVKSIISENCLSCHSVTGAWPGRPIAFDTDAQIAGSSAIIKASVADQIGPTNKRMPQDATLSQTNIDIIVAWYKAGGRTTD